MDIKQLGPIVLATANEHKAREIQQVLIGLEILPRPKNMPEVIEDGETLEDNALLKSRATRDFTKMTALSDDSGLEIEALNGDPGVRSARYAHPNASDSENVSYVLKKMVNESLRKAKFVTVIALSSIGGDEIVLRGEIEGVITKETLGTNGFGYDSIFIPNEGDGRTFGEMTAVEKNSISHRARALKRLRDTLGESHLN